MCAAPAHGRLLHREPQGFAPNRLTKPVSVMFSPITSWGGSARTSTACFLCQWHVWWQGHTISPPLRAWPTPPRQPSRFAWIVNTEVRRAGRRGEAVACGSDESRGAPTIARCGDKKDKKDLTFGAASPRARTPGSPSGIHDSPVPRKEVLHWAAFLTFLRASHFTAMAAGVTDRVWELQELLM